MKKITFITISIITLFSCDPNEKVYHPDLREAVENRKIKQIHEPAILQRGLKIGNEYAIIAEKTLGKALKSTIKEKGLEEAISFCNINAYPLLKELQDTNEVVIKRVSFKNRNPNNAPDELEAQLLDAFKYNEENKVESSYNIQKSGDTYYFVKPIFTKDLCLSCHGKVEENISTAHYEKIKALYSNDKAINYKAGELRGMWSIKIPKKNIVLSLSDDTWKYKYEKKKNK